jgi:hypothetical protein
MPVLLEPQPMIRDAVLHLANDQPLLVDLHDRPAATDALIVCTNVRTMTGTRPVWIDQSASTFFFPLGIVRFLEIHPGSDESQGPPGPGAEAAAGELGGPADGPVETELEIDEDFLRRVRDV